MFIRWCGSKGAYSSGGVDPRVYFHQVHQDPRVHINFIRWCGSKDACSSGGVDPRVHAHVHQVVWVQEFKCGKSCKYIMYCKFQVGCVIPRFALIVFMTLGKPQVVIKPSPSYQLLDSCHEFE